ncbi:hypothetical protein LZG04_10480 [Saccharothrix sp. S26]|uniref:hypothetical protein n=1 Tax=Saccharothrix sp. S26 TaxID=2907215 RepID=UPI001F34179E|nr:hypothetical protein [Saccharothrix sp. S26]MCE6995233.1 hypothetical protein [Saccharothrix sp. S26]
MRRTLEESGSLASLGELADDVKVLVLQQYFRHTQTGSHKTEFDRDTVGRLLHEWFGISLDTTTSDTAAGGDRFTRLPGRIGAEAVYRLDFGQTEVFLFMTPTKLEAARALVRSLAEDAVLTTEATSPPCEVAEFVPLWLKDRQRDPGEFYIDRDDHPIADYYASQERVLADELGVRVRESSAELALVANGDGLRYHRDRLVNQYALLERGEECAEDLRLVQDLTLIDWDMQAGTMSGTIFEHPDGDRYLFALHPGEVVGMFFSQRPVFPGPMMMPYHCALPVLDRESGRSVGAAKGKRLSALIRGLAAGDEVDALSGRAAGVALNDVAEETGGVRRYRDGLEVARVADLPDTAVHPVAHLAGDDQGVSVIELSTQDNRPLLDALGAPRGARLFRVDKVGEGFADLGAVVPGFAEAASVTLVNRTRRSPRQTSYPVAFDHTLLGLSWWQLHRLAAADVMRVPLATRSSLRLCPTDEILHRSALLDSFHSTGSLRPRTVISVDVVVA